MAIYVDDDISDLEETAKDEMILKTVINTYYSDDSLPFLVDIYQINATKRVTRDFKVLIASPSSMIFH